MLFLAESDVRALLPMPKAIDLMRAAFSHRFAEDPVFEASWVMPGVHFNAAGSNNPGRAEIPAELSAMPGRTSGITVFKSVGLGVEDIAAAGWVYEEALKAGRGSELPLFHS